MAHDRWSPTVVVGVDFGMTCTGVAFSSQYTDWARPEILQTWPDLKNIPFNKFPSRVAYNKAGEVVDWGRCNRSPAIFETQREFKLYLDSAFRDDAEDSPSHKDAAKCYVDYMTELHKHLETTFARIFPRWDEHFVEFRFSIPTTWNVRLTDQLKDWLAEAGFLNSIRRRVLFSRTEAEAAAIYVASCYRRNDVIMVVDAGGATTDINILEVRQKTDEITQLVALDKAEGINVGSVMIDTEARRLIADKLISMDLYSGSDSKWAAEDMMDQSGFEYYKCGFNGRNTRIDHYMDNPGRSQQPVVLKASELGEIFEALVKHLITRIGDKITWLAQAHPQKGLSYIVLSGGLGSSKYLEQRFTDEFCNGPHRPHNITNLKILVAEEPQLAVVKGLVMDRSQTIQHGVPVYLGRCARASYGLLRTIPYDGRKHAGEPIVTDDVTGELLIEDQVEWFIREGETVDENGLMIPLSLAIPKGQDAIDFRAYIVTTEDPPSNLPHSKHRGSVKKLCTVKGTFLPEHFATEDIRSVKRFFHKKKEHSIADFNLKVMLGSTDLGFEFVSLKGDSYSANPTKAKVKWIDAKPPQRRVDNYSNIFPHNWNR